MARFDRRPFERNVFLSIAELVGGERESLLGRLQNVAQVVLNANPRQASYPRPGVIDELPVV
jgi:hypothetical protein